MLNKDGIRELAYIVKIDEIEPILGSDNCEAAIVGGWKVMVKKEEYQVGDLAIYFEIDSKVPSIPAFYFLEKKHYCVKTQKYTFGGANKEGFYSQGLLMPLKSLGLEGRKVGEFVTNELGITYISENDRERKSIHSKRDKYQLMLNFHPNFARKFGKYCKKYPMFEKICYVFLGGPKKENDTIWPTGKFPGVSKTDQERVENMVWVLDDKTPFIVTEKCDGSSATYILKKKLFGYEFYVCSRNRRIVERKGSAFDDDNYYLMMSEKYEIESKMKRYLKETKCRWVSWQGEICGPKICSNRHHLKDYHLFMFHFTDSKNGRWNINEAEKVWRLYDMEVVPIINERYILPDTIEEFKLYADGVYDVLVCEGQNNLMREGLVLYKSDNPRFSFKNVSRKYLTSKLI